MTTRVGFLLCKLSQTFWHEGSSKPAGFGSYFVLCNSDLKNVGIPKHEVFYSKYSIHVIAQKVNREAGAI